MMEGTRRRTVLLSILSVLIIVVCIVVEPIATEAYINFLTDTSEGAFSSFSAFIMKAILFSLVYFWIILLIGKIFKIDRKDFGLTLGNIKRGLLWLLYFIIEAFVVSALYRWQGTYFATVHNSLISLIGQAHFNIPNAFLEELSCRALFLTLMLGLVSGRPLTPIKENTSKWRRAIAVAINAVMFGLMHIQVYFDPFEIYVPWLQIINATVGGALYCICFLRTGSVYWSALGHASHNLIIRLMSTLFYMYLPI